MKPMKHSKPAYTVIPSNIPNDGIAFVDHARNGRSGHGGNCLTQCRNGDIISFYSNVAGDVWGGHGVAGWSEYKISKDGGLTWSEPIVLDYSKQIWDGDDFYSALVFGLITAPNGTVIAVAARFASAKWIKEAPPVYLLSHDHGQTWSEAREMDPKATVYDLALTFDTTFVYEDTVYIVFFGDTANMGPGPYSLYASQDNGETFAKRSILPFDIASYYSTAAVLDDGRFIVYAYPCKNGNQTNEHDIDYVVSDDKGYSWSNVKTTYFAKRIRNPQMSAKIGGQYFMHGRSGSYGANPGNFVLYTSLDGIHWDDGIILHTKQTVSDAYSGNAIVRAHDPQIPDKLLIQSSISYDPNSACVNARHWWITFE